MSRYPRGYQERMKAEVLLALKREAEVLPVVSMVAPPWGGSRTALEIRCC